MRKQMLTTEERDLHILYIPQLRQEELTPFFGPGLFLSVSDPLGALEKLRLTE